MSQKLKILVLMLLAIISICGCSGSANSQQQNNYRSNDGYYEGEPILTDSQLPSNRKIIQNANLEIEAADADGLYELLANYSKELGGYEFSHNISNLENYSVINGVFKIPPENLKLFLNFAGESGKVINSRVSSEDITEDYFDIQIRLESKRKSLEQYYVLLQKTTTIEEIIHIQNTIDKITEDIESYEGKINVWNSLVDMATVNVDIRQENDPIKIRKDIHWNTLSLDDMSYLIKTGYVNVFNIIISILQWVLIAVLVCLPFLIIVIVFFIWKKHRKKPKDLGDSQVEKDE